MRRTRLKQKSSKQRLIDECEATLKKILVAQHGSRCQICGKNVIGRNLTLFHILPKGVYPKIRLLEENVLLACWFPCHNDWHHDYFKAQKIAVRIKELRGDDYQDRLKFFDKTAGKLSSFFLELWLVGLKQRLEQVS